MNYTLCLLTHGDHSDWVDATLDSFYEHVTPRPSHGITHHDGADGPLEGFAQATARLWEKAAAAPTDWIFWLEHDFVFTRPVDLTQLARVLDEEQALLQMALYREPVTLEEQTAGGYMRLHAGHYEPKLRGETRWFETVRNWTTNPSLFRTATAQAIEWPAEPDCETEFTRRLDLAASGRRFGIWGDGTPWVRHIGVRDGVGY